MQITYAHGHDYYTPFYLLATFTNVLLLLVEGWRRGFPLRPWLTLVAAASLALILGTKLITNPVGAWSTVLFGDELADTARSILGGGLAMGLTVLALRRWLGLPRAAFDALPLPLCAALAVQCVGCVLTGCCFGLPTNGAWGITYAAGTLPYWAQVHTGLLPIGAAHSLPVAPTQLMALGLCVAVGGVLLAARHRRWPVGSWWLLQAGLLVLGRFGLSFWRDPAGEPVAGTVHKFMGGQWLGVQFLLLPAGLLLLGTWAWRVRHYTAATEGHTANTVAGGRSRTMAVALVLLALTAVLGQQALTLPELLVVRAILLTVLLAEASAVLTSLRLHGPRLVGVPLALLLLGVILLNTAQKMPPELDENKATVTHTTIITGGVLGNHHEAEQRIAVSNSGCSGSQELALQQQVYGAGGEIAFEDVELSGKTDTWGGGVWVGQQNIDAQPLPSTGGSTTIFDQPTSLQKTLVDVHFYREVHSHYRGWLTTDTRIGLHFGSLGHFSYFGEGESKESTPIMPELMLRIGEPSVLFAQADLCYGAENTMGAYTARYALGSGLGLDTGTRVLAGYANSPHQPSPSMGFVSAELRLPGKTGLSLEPYYATDLGRHNNFSMKVHYRLGR